MAFNQLVVKNYAPTVVALNAKTAGTVTSAPALQLPVGSPAFQFEWESLTANVSAAITTSTLVVTTRWEVSNDNVTWVPLMGLNGPANVSVAAAGTGSLVTTAYAQSLAGINLAYPYVRLAVVNTVATGGAGDNVTVSYNWRKRWTT